MAESTSGGSGGGGGGDDAENAPNPSGKSGPSVSLTRREVEVLALVIQGKSSQEAAEALFVSKRTIDFHLQSIYNKLQVRNRMQAMREAARRGLLPFDINGDE